MLYYRNINLCMRFQVRSKSSATFTTKLSVTTVNYRSQLLLFFITKSSILDRAWTKYCNIIHEHSKRCWGATFMIESSFRKIWKAHSPRCPKIHFHRVFAMHFHRFSQMFFWIYLSNGLNGVNFNSLTQIMALF